MASRPLAVQAPGGLIRGRVIGTGERLALCLPGIAANHRSFDALARSLAPERRVAAIDFRGRGDSPAGGSGYGWARHARDARAVADRLGSPRVDLIGHSMGAFVAMRVAADAPGSIGRLVLLDGAGTPESAALRSIAQTARAVGSWFPSADAYVAAMRSRNVIEPWSETWSDSLRYELVPARKGARRGVRLRTSQSAVMQDSLHGAAHDPRRLWPALTMPVLLVRATLPLAPHGGLVVPHVDVARLAAALPRLEVVEVRANHYGVIAHRDTLRAVGAFLRRPVAALR